MTKNKYTFLDLAFDVLTISTSPLTPNEIWNIAKQHKLTDKLNSLGKTPISTLSARIYTSIKTNSSSKFIQVSKRPVKFYLKNKEIISQDNTSNTTKKLNFNERDLHILLSSFVYANPHFKCMTKTIYHEKSSKMKKGYNKWLHPDMVGVHFPFEEYNASTLKLQDVLLANSYKIYSFELKISLDLYNLREYFFQAVSNSSWANEGYLVVLNLDTDESFESELRLLNNAFGIGVIKLNPDIISQSEIILTAKENHQLDWNMIDRLMENPDFKSFITDILEDDKLKKVKSSYDKILDDDKCREYTLKKHIY